MRSGIGLIINLEHICIVMTNLSEKEHQAQMADMRSFDEQMSCLGVFWYGLNDHTLFGVWKKELTPREVEEATEKGMPFINYPHLHRHVWAKNIFWQWPSTWKQSSKATTHRFPVAA